MNCNLWTNLSFDLLGIAGMHRFCQSKQSFGKIFTEAWDKAATPANIKGFRATGIYPFNPSIIPDEAFVPSLVRHN